MEQLDINQLHGNKKNPRVISRQDYASLVQSIKRFGDLSGIVFNVTTQQLAGGHQRIQAFKELGGRPIITERYEQPNSVGTTAIGYVLLGDEKYAYREVQWDIDFEAAANIAANRISGEFDNDMLAQITYEISQAENSADLLALTGLAEDEINKLLDQVGANGEHDPAEDEAPEVDEVNPPVSKLGEIYQLGRHRLMCGDSTDYGQLSDLMNGQVADLVFTDPPYGVNYQSNMRTESAQFEVIKNDDKLISEWIEPVLAVSQGFVFIWTSWKVIDKWIELTKTIGDMTNMIIWDKGGGGIGDLQGTYASDFEVALVFNRGAKLTGERLGSVWSISKDAPSTYERPTQKPVGLAEMAIRTTTFRGNVVLDVFGGSGSTLIAAEVLGRDCRMMELDPKYCDVIRKRYAKHIGAEDWIAATPVIQSAEDEQTPPPAPADSQVAAIQ